MFNKSLVAVYFLGNKVLAVELNANGKSVKNFATADVPLDTIKNGRVENPEKLSRILQKLWDENGLKEKTACLIIPEFSTFTKLLKLPKLSVGELGEAVSWQAADYLPQAPEKMIMDWKIVSKLDEKGGYEVLVVAVPSEVLMGYVEAAESAQLFPYAVEIPSLSLVNLTKNVEGGVLTIYTSYGETIIMCSVGEKILGTSVLKDTNLTEILDTSEKMVSHFKDSDIKKVYIGGHIDEQFVSQTKSRLKMEIGVLAPSAGNISKDKIQEYLVPLSVQTDKVGEPSDPKSLNLLPYRLVDKYQKDKTKIQLWSITLTVTLFVWVSFIIVLASYLVINQQISNIKEANAARTQVENTRITYEKEAKAINDASEKVLKIKSAYKSPEIILNNIQLSKPQGVNITRYNLDLDMGMVLIYGVSPNRTSLVTFKENLESIQEISQVNIPINSFESETNLEFQLSFQYGPPPPAKPNFIGK